MQLFLEAGVRRGRHPRWIARTTVLRYRDVGIERPAMRLGQRRPTADYSRRALKTDIDSRRRCTLLFLPWMRSIKEVLIKGKCRHIPRRSRCCNQTLTFIYTQKTCANEDAAPRRETVEFIDDSVIESIPWDKMDSKWYKNKALSIFVKMV